MRYIWLYGIVVLLAGCAALRPEAQPEIPGEPVFMDRELRAHLRQFQRTEPEGEAAQARQRMVDYAAARMDDFMLQPAFSEVQRQIFHSPPPDGHRALNVGSYLGGKNPRHFNQLLIVGVDLEVIVRERAQHAAISAAAMLEAGRTLGELHRFHRVPDHTVYFTLWFGDGPPHQGLRAYLEDPAWPLDSTLAIVYVGLPSADVAAVDQMVAGYGVSLIALSLPDTAQVQAVRVARAMAGELYSLILREALRPGPSLPVNEDAVPVPFVPRWPEDEIR